jgi:hypothetical protein
LTNLTSFTIDYEYTNYRISYPITQLIPSTQYTIDYETKIVDFDGGLIVAEAYLNKGIANKYQIFYDYVKEVREDIAALKDYFTPILKDYVLKLLPKG